jgi:hypothetical protein
LGGAKQLILLLNKPLTKALFVVAIKNNASIVMDTAEVVTNKWEISKTKVISANLKFTVKLNATKIIKVVQVLKLQRILIFAV